MAILLCRMQLQIGCISDRGWWRQQWSRHQLPPLSDAFAGDPWKRYSHRRKQKMHPTSGTRRIHRDCCYRCSYLYSHRRGRWLFPSVDGHDRHRRRHRRRSDDVRFVLGAPPWPLISMALCTLARNSYCMTDSILPIPSDIGHPRAE